MLVVISVAHHADNEQIKQAILLSDKIRAATLKRCCAIPGYLELPLKEKNKVYDNIKTKVEKELIP